MSRWQTQSGKRRKAVRTARGTEYLNKELEIYFTSKGVIHQTTATYTPEQNGVAQRFNRTLMERVRAMFHVAKLGKEIGQRLRPQPPMWRTGAQQFRTLRRRGSYSIKQARCLRHEGFWSSGIQACAKAAQIKFKAGPTQ